MARKKQKNKIRKVVKTKVIREKAIIKNICDFRKTNVSKKCTVCGSRFSGMTKSRYCSNACKQSAYRHFVKSRRRIEEIERELEEFKRR